MPESHSWEPGMTGIQQESRRGYAQLAMNVQGWKEKWKAGEWEDRGEAEIQQGRRGSEGKGKTEEAGRGFSGDLVTAEHAAHACGGSSPHATPPCCAMHVSFTARMWFSTHENHASVPSWQKIPWMKLCHTTMFKEFQYPHRRVIFLCFAGVKLNIMLIVMHTTSLFNSCPSWLL